MENGASKLHVKDLAEKKTWTLVPASSAVVFPDYVPEPIRLDYQEACAIKELSPKASATLARRCLQGMIRDFHGIAKKRLVDEIEALRDKIDARTWEGIDAIRKVGNIGAHMEADIDVIVDVDPGEAETLLKLIEALVKEWYIGRHDRDQRVQAVIAVAEAKRGKA
jgi:hypothetical protein